jgi:hypothetical protein
MRAFYKFDLGNKYSKAFAQFNHTSGPHTRPDEVWIALSGMSVIEVKQSEQRLKLTV